VHGLGIIWEISAVRVNPAAQAPIRRNQTVVARQHGGAARQRGGATARPRGGAAAWRQLG